MTGDATHEQMITFHLDAAADRRRAGKIQALRHRSLFSLRRDVAAS
jgi:hypothetical protein